MADEQEAIAPSGQETAPATEAVETTTTTTEEPERILDPGEAGEIDDGAAAEEEVEIDWEDGKKYRIPKALEGGILRNKDYTQKRQSDAEAARARVAALDQREAGIEERLKVTEAELDVRAALRNVNAELERFKAYDWNAYQQARQSDPLGADEAWNYAQHMRNQKAELEGALGKAAQQRANAQRGELAKRIQETTRYAQEHIKGWSPDLDKKIVTFAKEHVPIEFLQRNMSPKLYEMIHLARLGSEVLKSQAAPKPATTVNPPAPLATVNGRSSPASRGNLADMDMESYAAARKRGVGGKPTVR